MGGTLKVVSISPKNLDGFSRDFEFLGRKEKNIVYMSTIFLDQEISSK